MHLVSKIGQWGGGGTRLKQHISQIIGQTTSCPKDTKEDQLKYRNAIDACVYRCRIDYIYQVLNFYLADLSYNTY